MSKPGGDPSSGINSGDAWDGPSGIRHVGGAEAGRKSDPRAANAETPMASTTTQPDTISAYLPLRWQVIFQSRPLEWGKTRQE
jgi:hypothetical protein